MSVHAASDRGNAELSQGSVLKERKFGTRKAEKDGRINMVRYSTIARQRERTLKDGELR